MKLSLLHGTCSMVELMEVSDYDVENTPEWFEVLLEEHVKQITPIIEYSLNGSRPKIMIYNADGEIREKKMKTFGFETIHTYAGWEESKKNMRVMVREIKPLLPK